MRSIILSAFIFSIVMAGGSVAFGQSEPAPAAPTDIRFNFKGATFQQVIEFFSRTTGLPVIWQTPAPEGTLDYISPNGYGQAEALRVLNMILQSKGVMLRVSDSHLHLQKLDQMQRSDVPTFIGKIPGEITPDQIVSLVVPLKISLAKPLAERLANMVAAYGAVTAMEQQNSLVITETAANAQRLLTMIEQLDRDDPEGAVEIFPVHNAKATEMMVPLKALLSQRVEKFVINQQGQQVKIEEEQMPGLMISADDRTNSIIAKGVQSKIDKLREAIRLLDVPGAGQNRSMTTMALSRITPADAVAKLNQLFQRIPEKDRPTVVALDDAAKVMIIGDDAAVTEGTLLVRELENGPVGANGREGNEPVISVLPLERAAPAAIITAINSLLSKRQQTAVKLIAGTDGRSIILSGLAADVEAVKALVPVLDRQAAGDRQVRLVRIANGDPLAILDQARQVFVVSNPEFAISDLKSQIANLQPEAIALAVDLDGESRTVTLVGPLKAVDAFTSALKQIESTVVIDREARRFTLAHVLPSEVVGPLQAIAAQALQPTGGSQYLAPVFAAVDQLNLLMVTATPSQFTGLAPLIESLDVAGSAEARPSPKLLQLRFADAANLANVLTAQYNLRPAAERKAKPVFIGADPQTNALLVSVHPQILPDIQAMVDELNKIERADSEARELHIYPLKAARAEELARTIDEVFPQPPPPLDARGRPQPQLQKPRPVIVRAEPQTNSLIISALPGVFHVTQEMIAQLDIDPSQTAGAAAKAIHVLTVENTDAIQLAANLEAIFSGPGAASGPQNKPTIRVDAASNSLLIRANEVQMQTIREVVAKVDKATITSSRQMRLIPIDPSKSSAEDVARALERMLGNGDGAKVQVISLEELIEQRKQGDANGAKSAQEGSR